MTEIPGYEHLPDRFDYTFNCPVGMWNARLDAKAWGKQRNILLYFTEVESRKKYVLSVFLTGAFPYQPEDGSLNFKVAAEPGDFFELTTAETRTGKSKLVSARKIQPSTPSVMTLETC